MTTRSEIPGYRNTRNYFFTQSGKDWLPVAVDREFLSRTPITPFLCQSIWQVRPTDEIIESVSICLNKYPTLKSLPKYLPRGGPITNIERSMVQADQIYVDEMSTLSCEPNAEPLADGVLAQWGPREALLQEHADAQPGGRLARQAQANFESVLDQAQ